MLVLQACARALTPQQASSIAYEFEALDIDRNGVISVVEILEAVRACNGSSNAEIDLLSASILLCDPDCVFTYSEFIGAAMYRRFTLNDNGVVSAFNALDYLHTGRLTLEMFEGVMGSDDIGHDANMLLKALDMNSDGVVTINDFSNYWKHVLTDGLCVAETEDAVVRPIVLNSDKNRVVSDLKPVQLTSLITSDSASVSGTRLPSIKVAKPQKSPSSRTSLRSNSATLSPQLPVILSGMKKSMSALAVKFIK
jgi:Ca2+-binding EF-hand superfamily protein